MAIKSGSQKPFSIKDYQYFSEIPLEALDRLNYSVYLVDYNWVYLFINKNARTVFGDFADTLIGRSALDVFKDPKFHNILAKLERGIVERIALHETIHSPLRGRQINVKGYPLLDCYLFSVTTFPGRVEIVGELSEELKKRRRRGNERM